MKRKYALALLPGALFISALAVGAAFGYRINVTQSLPLGIWQKTPDSKGAAYVEFCLPESEFAALVREREYTPHGTCPGGLAPLLKPVVAQAGDLVVITDKGLAVNGKPLLTEPIREHDSKGRPLPAMKPGSYPVPEKALWVISTYHPRSLDSRYYGAISEASVIAGMRPVFVFNQREDYALVYR
jgi:conjugative transfer signal peptidase TraF